MPSSSQLRNIIQIAAEAIIENEDLLNSLDRSIGDGDHGYNMSRGGRAVLDQIEEINFNSLADFLSSTGTILINTIGGASGALYGSLLTSMGEYQQNKEPTFQNFVQTLDSGVSTMKELGDSDINQKTMLDVIIPVVGFLRNSDHPELDKTSELARESCQLTKGMRAEKGRASFLGDRSIGHTDPGAKSSEIIISSICRALGQ